MVYNVPLKKKDKVRFILKLFSLFAPFSKMSNRETDVMAKYIDIYYKLKDKLPESSVASVMFDYDYTLEIAEGLKITIENVRNHVSKLRAKGLIDGHFLSKSVIDLFNAVDDDITFKLETKD